MEIMFSSRYPKSLTHSFLCASVTTKKPMVGQCVLQVNLGRRHEQFSAIKKIVWFGWMKRLYVNVIGFSKAQCMFKKCLDQSNPLCPISK